MLMTSYLRIHEILPLHNTGNISFYISIWYWVHMIVTSYLRIHEILPSHNNGIISVLVSGPHDSDIISANSSGILPT